jgi:hypothetical protein
MIEVLLVVLYTVSDIFIILLITSILMDIIL